MLRGGACSATRRGEIIAAAMTAPAQTEINVSVRFT
jgi:hypothetical protein